MKISYNWLKEYLDFDMSPTEVADVLTMLGLETEGKPEKIGGVEGNFEGVVVGHVLSIKAHPGADRLRVCEVNIGSGDPLQIVCGAANVAEGQKVPVATVGTTLHPVEAEKPLKIKKGKIRGEVSLGMICAEDELGIGHNHDGIMVLDAGIDAGTPFYDIYEVDEDYMIEIDLTPNRIDAASHYGTARDLAAFLGKKASLPEISLKKEQLSGKNPIPVTIADKEKCKRYTSMYIKDVKVAESPDWLKQRLTTIGLRPRNNVVDITNYVLHELGHPMHAFDADQLSGKEIIVRTLDADMKYTTLDGEERELKANSDLLICDAEQPRCIAGTMGGMTSAVTEETTNVFLESAYFDPGTVRKQAKRLGIHSDSSFRFERGADPHMTETALMRAASMILEIAGGSASQVDDLVVAEFPHTEIDLSVKRTHSIIGVEIGKERITEILQLLEIEVSADADGDTLHLRVPPYRVDVTRPQDVQEEILRIYGYDNIAPSASISQSLTYKQHQDSNSIRQRYADYLSANGFYEIMNNSLINKNLGDENAIALVNPLSEELGILRQSLLSGFLDSIRHNQNRQNEDLAFYEFGKTYWKEGDSYQEKSWLCMAVTGKKAPMHWTGAGATSSLYTLGKEVERMQAWFGLGGTLAESDHGEFDYGLALLNKNKTPLIQYGKVKGELTEAYDIRNEVFFLIADYDAIMAEYFRSEVKFKPIPQFPGTSRDISMIIGADVAFADIRRLVTQANPKLIRSVNLHDVYQGKNIPEGKKSYLVSVDLRDDNKTIEDKAAEKITKRAYMLLEKELGAEIRM